MSKPRNDSNWKSLTPKQKDMLKDWLFVQNLGYPEVLEIVRKEWGIDASKSSLARYYQVLVHEQMRANLDAAQATALMAQRAKLNLNTLREGVLKLIGRRLLETALQSGEAKELTSLASLLMANEQQQIQRAWLKLAQEKFQFKAARAALKALPLLDEFQQQEMDQEQERIKSIRRILFGEPEPSPAESTQTVAIPDNPA